jgi:hypothetical protein
MEKNSTTTPSHVHISVRSERNSGSAAPTPDRARTSQSDHGIVSSGNATRKNHQGCTLLKPEPAKRSK